MNVIRNVNSQDSVVDQGPLQEGVSEEVFSVLAEVQLLAHSRRSIEKSQSLCRIVIVEKGLEGEKHA